MDFLILVRRKYYKEKDTRPPLREGTPLVHSTNPWYGRVPPSIYFISSSSVTCISGLELRKLSDIQNFSLTVLISDPVSITPFVFTLLANISHSFILPFNLFNVS